MTVRRRLAAAFAAMIGATVIAAGGIGSMPAMALDSATVGPNGTSVDAAGVGTMGVATHISSDLGAGPLTAVITVGISDSMVVTITSFSGGNSGESCVLLDQRSAQCTFPAVAGNDYTFTAGITLDLGGDSSDSRIVWADVAVKGPDGSPVDDVNNEWPLDVQPTTTTTTVPETTTTVEETTTTTVPVTFAKATTTAAPATTAAPRTTATTLPNTGTREHLARTASVGLALVLLGIALLSGAAALGRRRDED